MKKPLATRDPELRKGVQSVEHGAKLLEALIDSPGAMPLKDLAARAKMSASMAHRYLASMIRADLIAQNPINGHYDLSSLALRLGLAALNRSDFIQIADEEMRRLVEKISIDGSITIWGDYGATTVRAYSGKRPILTNLRLGGVLPLLTATGRIFLAHMPRETTQPMLAKELEGRTDIDPAQIDQWIAEVRRNGFSALDGMLISGLKAISAPVFNMQGELLAAVSLVGPQKALMEIPGPVTDLFLAAARRASQRLGFESAGAAKSV